jgi:hypothetical protein
MSRPVALFSAVRPRMTPAEKRLHGPWGTGWARGWCLIAGVVLVVLLVVLGSRPAPCQVVLHSDGSWESTTGLAVDPLTLRPGCTLVYQP